MTITDLMVNFRAGLLGLIPRVERVGIPWRRPDAYDEWDDLAAAVYRALIVEPLCSALPEDERDGFTLPDYDMLLPTYAGMSVIEVLPARSDGLVKVFHAFGTAVEPFDIVEWRAVPPTGSPRSDVLESVPLEEARFALRIRMNGCGPRRIEEVTPPAASPDSLLG